MKVEVTSAAVRMAWSQDKLHSRGILRSFRVKSQRCNNEMLPWIPVESNPIQIGSTKILAAIKFQIMFGPAQNGRDTFMGHPILSRLKSQLSCIDITSFYLRSESLVRINCLSHHQGNPKGILSATPRMEHFEGHSSLRSRHLLRLIKVWLVWEWSLRRGR